MRINQHLLTDSGEVTSKRECWGFKWQHHTILFNERLRQRIVWLLICALVVLIIIILVEENQRFICCVDGKLETYERLFEPSCWQQTGDLWKTFLTIVVTANWRPMNNFLNHCVDSKREPLSWRYLFGYHSVVCAKLFMVTVKFMHGEPVLVFMSYSSACSWCIDRFEVYNWFILGDIWWRKFIW